MLHVGTGDTRGLLYQSLLLNPENTRNIEVRIILIICVISERAWMVLGLVLSRIVYFYP